MQIRLTKGHEMALTAISAETLRSVTFVANVAIEKYLDATLHHPRKKITRIRPEIINQKPK